jgi:cholesterol transport system auxiliary component
MPAPGSSATAAAPLLLGLTVARPRSATSLDTDRIAVVAAGRRFDYYAGVRWADAAPHMLQQQIVQGLVGSGRFAAVHSAPSRVPAELLLDVELRRFEADTSAGGAPVVHVQLQASLIDTRRGVRAASFVSEAAVPAGANRREAIVEAFDRAAAQVVAEVVERAAVAAAALEPVVAD